MQNAHTKPRWAPSLRMVRLIGPTGMQAKISAQKNPANAASNMGCAPAAFSSSDNNRGINAASQMWGTPAMSASILRFVVVFFLNLPPPSPREAGPDKSVNQIRREEDRQHVVQDLLLQHHQRPQEQHGDDHF